MKPAHKIIATITGIITMIITLLPRKAQTKHEEKK
jgi:hypothetical protein